MKDVESTPRWVSIDGSVQSHVRLTNFFQVKRERELFLFHTSNRKPLSRFLCSFKADSITIRIFHQRDNNDLVSHFLYCN